MNEASTEHALSVEAGWIVTLIVLVFLIALCVYRNLQAIPADISYRVHTALEQAGYGRETIHVDGRDVILTARRDATDAARITDIVKSVRGVREVRANLEIVPARLPQQQMLSKDRPYATVGI